jgi:hypothetical protein
LIALNGKNIMTTTTQNKALINKATDNLPVEHTLQEMKVVAARLPIQLIKEPLLSSSMRQSPRLGTNGQLAAEKMERSRWDLNRFPRISRSLLSNAFNYILRRTTVIPSMLFRRIDLPLFRRKLKPGNGFRAPGGTIPDGHQVTPVPGRDETPFDMSPDSSGDKRTVISYIG